MKNLKSIILLLCLLFMLKPAEAQEEEYKTIFSSGTSVTGWFAEISTGISEINNKDAYIAGISGGIVINHHLNLGVDFKSFSWHDEYMKFNDILEEPCYLTGGYGGLLIEPILKPNKVIHLTFPIIIGGGGAEYLSITEYQETEHDGEIDFKYKSLSTSVFFAIEPGCNLEVNVTHFMKFSTGISYRNIIGMHLDNTDPEAFNNGSINVGLQFGKF